jgi:hypothetical protein
MAFGRIVQAFVIVETVYKLLISNILKIDEEVGLLALCGYSYDGLKNLLKCTVSECQASEEQIKTALDLIDKVNDKSILRNNVAHNPWAPGKRHQSVKPMVLKAKGKTLKILGAENNERDWTAEELSSEADDILKRLQAVCDLFGTTGVIVGDPQN